MPFTDREKIARIEKATGQRITGAPAFWVVGTDKLQSDYTGGWQGLKSFIVSVLMLPIRIIEWIFGSFTPDKPPEEIEPPPDQPDGDLALGEPDMPEPDKPGLIGRIKQRFEREPDSAEQFIDVWADVEFVIAVPRMEHKEGWFKSALELTEDAPTQLLDPFRVQLRAKINDITGGKGNGRFVTQRFSPVRFSSLESVFGKIDKITVFTLVKKHDLGLKGLIVAKGEQLIEKRAEDIELFEPVFERTEPEKFKGARAAIDQEEPGRGDLSTWLLNLIGILLPFFDDSMKKLFGGRFAGVFS